MNNAQFFYDSGRIVEAWKAWRTATDRSVYHGPDEEKAFAELAGFCANSAVSSALKFRVGDIVQVDWNQGGTTRRRFGKVVGFRTGDYGEVSVVRVTFGDPNAVFNYRVGVDDWEKFKADIPPELLELAKNELAKSAKGMCPLMKGGCDGD